MIMIVASPRFDQEGLQADPDLSSIFGLWHHHHLYTVVVQCSIRQKLVSIHYWFYGVVGYHVSLTH